jgi:hypothetical protein
MVGSFRRSLESRSDMRGDGEDTFYVPLGLGAGKVWRLAGGRRPAFAEPQCTVLHDGIAPQWQVFIGLDMQFPIGHR